MTYSTDNDFIEPSIQNVGEIRYYLFWRRPVYRLTEDYWFEWGKSRKRLFIKRGIEYDLASTPIGSEIVGFPSNGVSDAASMVHDMFCRNNYNLIPGCFEYETQNKDGGWDKDLTRWRGREVNALYEHMCALAGMSRMKALVEACAITVYNLPKGL